MSYYETYFIKWYLDLNSADRQDRLVTASERISELEDVYEEITLNVTQEGKEIEHMQMRFSFKALRVFIYLGISQGKYQGKMMKTRKYLRYWPNFFQNWTRQSSDLSILTPPDLTKFL